MTTSTLPSTPSRSRSGRRPGRAALAAAAAGLLAATLAACGGDATGNEDAVRDDGSVDLAKVTLVVGDQRSSSQEALLAAAGLDDTEYTIDFKEFASGPPMLEALGSGALNVGYVGNTPPIFAAAGDAEFKIVQATTYGGLGDAIVVPEDSPLQSVEDLAGTKVAVASGSSANYNLLAQLAQAGVDYDDVETQNLQPADALAAFTQGYVDAWTVWEPYTSQAEAEGGRVLADGEDVVNGMNFQVASDAALDDKATTAALEDYLHRVTEAQQWAADHQQEWAQVWAEQTGLSPDVTLAAAKKRPLTVLPVGDEVVSSEQEIADAFSDKDLLPSPVDMGDFVDDRFNESLSDLMTPAGQ